MSSCKPRATGSGTLTTSSLRAELNLQSLAAGVHSVPVKVEAADPLAQVLSVTPKSLDVSLEPELRREITPTVMIVDLNLLPPGYMVGEPSVAPGSLSLSGPRSLVERVAAARIDLVIGERRADFQDTFRPLLLDSAGYTVRGGPGQPAAGGRHRAGAAHLVYPPGGRPADARRKGTGWRITSCAASKYAASHRHPDRSAGGAGNRRRLTW